jgi:hypothetical protein
MVEGVGDALQPEGPHLDPCAMGVEAPTPLGRIVGGE